MKQEIASRVLCDHRIPIKLKGKFQKTDTRLVMLYAIECQTTKKQHVHEMSVAEMRMLSWISGNTRKDIIQNQKFA